MASPSDSAKRVDGRVGADEGGVDRPREQRLAGLGAGVVGADVSSLASPRASCEDAVLDADDGRGVGDVGEVAQVERAAGLAGDLTGGLAGCAAPIAALVVVTAAGGGQRGEGEEEGQGAQQRPRAAPALPVGNSDRHNHVFYMTVLDATRRDLRTRASGV